MKWNFAIEPFNGDLHIFEHEMPAVDNLVVVEIADKGHGMHFIADADAQALRELLATHAIREVVHHVGPDVADKLDDMLTAIHLLIDKRTAELRAPDDEEANFSRRSTIAPPRSTTLRPIFGLDFVIGNFRG